MEKTILVAGKDHPEVMDFSDGVLMSGSGSTVFGITKDRQLIEDTMNDLKKEKYFVRRTRIVDSRMGR